MIDLILSVLMIITSVGIVYYWIDFYRRKGVQVIQEEWYLKFQKACSIADIWIVVSSFLGAIGILTGQSFGVLFSILAGSSIIFLALLDIGFNIENNLYRLIGESREMVFELGINFWTLILGIVLIVFYGVTII